MLPTALRWTPSSWHLPSQLSWAMDAWHANKRLSAWHDFCPNPFNRRRQEATSRTLMTRSLQCLVTVFLGLWAQSPECRSHVVKVLDGNGQRAVRRSICVSIEHLGSGGYIPTTKSGNLFILSFGAPRQSGQKPCC
jgi:hypothetical protein